MNSQSNLTVCFHLALLIWTCSVLGTNAHDASPWRLLNTLKQVHDFKEDPVGGSQGPNPLTVQLDVSLIDIVQADASTNQLDLVLWTPLFWPSNIRWNPRTQYGSRNFTELRIPASDIWKPDIVVYRATTTPQDIYPDINVVLQNNGEVTYVPGKRLRVMCDLSYLDSDKGAECAIKFGSWTYNGHQMDLKLRHDSPGLNLDDYVLSPTYEILNNTAKRNEIFYPCCPEPYVDITYKLTIRARR